MEQEVTAQELKENAKWISDKFSTNDFKFEYELTDFNHIDQLIDNFHSQVNQLDEATRTTKSMNLTVLIGSYLGEAILNKYADAAWVIEDTSPSKIGSIYIRLDQDVKTWPFAKAYKRIVDKTEERFTHYAEEVFGQIKAIHEARIAAEKEKSKPFWKFWDKK